MALTGVLRAGFVQFRVLEMDEAITHYVDHIGLDLVEKADDGRFYLSGYDEFDRHSIVLREADAPGVDFMAFKVAGDADLDAFEKRTTDFGLDVDQVAADEQPGVGRRIGFVLPSGHRIELYAEMVRSDNGPITENPDVWRDDPRGMFCEGGVRTQRLRPLIWTNHPTPWASGCTPKHLLLPMPKLSL